MKIRKQILKKLKKAYEGGMLYPPYPYTLHSHVLMSGKRGFYHVGCGSCNEHGYKMVVTGGDSTCDCEISGKGTAHTNKLYKVDHSFKRRFYFKDVGELPFFIEPDEKSSKNLTNGLFWVTCVSKGPYKTPAHWGMVSRFKHKKTVMVFIS